eukprot:NODE_4987_length_1823_cov_7.564269.p1 GENE.NODE_4987_length_1823_cov_7.564269~~NODE_4987_length_1823_cov_7.564269.p1  ORF type:complete len:332 (-),score=79.70 NODE_4987_length_1823_cov_7.564269:652-1647(-)
MGERVVTTSSASINVEDSPMGPSPHRSCHMNADHFWVPGSILIGLLVGALAPASRDSANLPAWASSTSSVLGWTYFFAWSTSFYPQVVMNFKNKSVVGLSLDFQLLNAMGFICYFSYSAMLYYSPLIQKEYSEAHNGNSSAVQLNDVVFAGHALLITLVTLAQIVVYYDYPPLDPADRTIRIIVVVALVLLFMVAAALATLVSLSAEGVLSWLGFLNIVSVVKLAVSVAKYCPQVWMNYRRQSTKGWNIYNVILDFIGGSLSVAQLLFDAGMSQEWGQVTGDPVKLGLGNIAMVFDTIFVVQHYCLYNGRRSGHRDGNAAAPLNSVDPNYE